MNDTQSPLGTNANLAGAPAPASNFEVKEIRANSRKFYHSWQFILNTLRIADVVMVLIAGAIVHLFGVSGSYMSPPEWMFSYFSAILTLVALELAQSYRPFTVAKLDEQLSALFTAGVGTLLVLLIGGFFTGSLHSYSRTWVLGAILVGSSLLIANRIAASIVARKFTQLGYLREQVILVGANERAEKIILNLASDGMSDVKLLGIFDDRTTRLPENQGFCPVLGTIDDLLAYVRSNRIDRIIVTLPWTAAARLHELLKKLRTVPVRIDLVPHDIIWHFPSLDLSRVANIPVITFANRRLDDQIGLLKRVEDIVLSILLLILTSPFMLLIALAIKLDSPGPVFFRQKRHGFNNEVFEVFKFRTMRAASAPDPKVSQATRNDPRVTRTGKILRRLSLDELPQLLNVLGGTMSVVGPRPHAVPHNLQYAEVIEEYFARHNVKPGITGWAQINGFRGETDTDEKMRKRVEYDLHYIEHWSLLFDLKIVLMTAIVTVWPQENAY